MKDLEIFEELTSEEAEGLNGGFGISNASWGLINNAIRGSEVGNPVTLRPGFGGLSGNPLASGGGTLIGNPVTLRPGFGGLSGNPLASGGAALLPLPRPEPREPRPTPGPTPTPVPGPGPG